MSQVTIEQAMQLAQRHLYAGELGKAAAIYGQILSVQPTHPDALHLLGVIAGQSGHGDEGANLIRRAIAAAPDNPHFHCNLGLCLQNQGQLEQAIACFGQALVLKPDFVDAHNNLGVALASKGQFDQAIACHERALALNPDFAEAYYNLGVALADQGQYDRAMVCYEKALSLQPDLSSAHWNRGLLLLKQGKYEEGWTEFERRWRVGGFMCNPKTGQQWLDAGILLGRRDELAQKYATHPRWHGTALDGQRILIQSEQGFGDSLQFVRFFPRVAQLGGKILAVVPAELLELFKGQNIPGVEHWLGPNDPAPTFDFHCPMMSLANIFKITSGNIPAEIPYLRADPARSALWKSRLPEGGLKVGLAWAGKMVPDPRRSMKLQDLETMLGIPDITWVSLQKGNAASQAKHPPLGMQLNDWTDELMDFADTAALIDNLDLVISIDTAVAHLAGAMGKPVWLMLSFVADWRWLLDRADSPWYPTMRLFRQPTAGNWSAVTADLAVTLRSRVGERHGA